VDSIRRTLPWILPFKLIVFFVFNLYRGMWRYTSMQDLKNVVKASSISSIVIVLMVLFLFRFEGFPRSVFAIDWVLTLLFISGARIAVRLILANNISSFWKIGQQRTDRRIASTRRQVRLRNHQQVNVALVAGISAGVTAKQNDLFRIASLGDSTDNSIKLI